MGSSFLFITFFILMAITHCHADMISEVCKDTTDNAACLNYLKGDPKTSSAKDFKELSKFTLELAIRKTSESQNWIKDLLKTKEDPSIKICGFEAYDEVVGSFKSSIRELDEDPQTANYDAKVAGDGAEQCQNVLEQAGIQNPEITARNKDAMLLSDIAFEVTNRIS